MSYDWKAALVFLAALVAMTVVGRWLAFRAPELRRMRALNREADARKLARPRFAEAVRVAALAGAPLHAVSMAVATLVFTQVNTINHTFVHLPRFPWRTLDRITSLHAAHHVDMNRGNYATLTMLYDWLFGTLERPVVRSEP